MENKITSINLGDRDEMKANIEKMKRSLPAWVGYSAILAEARKISYDACIKQGFTPEQALELCKSMAL